MDLDNSERETELPQNVEQLVNDNSDYLYIEQLLMNEVDNNVDNDIEDGNAQDLVQRIFNNVPMNERFIWLDRMNLVLRLRDEYYALRNRNRNPTFKIIWVGWNGKIPLPWVNYTKIIKKIEFQKILDLVKVFLLSVFSMLKYVFVIITFLDQVFLVARSIIYVTNMLTFSNNFIGQIISFIFENDPAMIAQSSEIYRLRKKQMCDGTFQPINSRGWAYVIRVAVNWINGDEWLAVTTKEGHMNLGNILSEWAYKKLAESMLLKCSYSCDNLDFGICSANRDTLIFKFANVLGIYFPLITDEEWLQKTLTLVVWIVYLSGAFSIFCFTFWNTSVRMGKIASRYIAFIVPIAKSVTGIL